MDMFRKRFVFLMVLSILWVVISLVLIFFVSVISYEIGLTIMGIGFPFLLIFGFWLFDQ